MDAFSTAARILGGIELTPGQLAQLRAIDHKWQQRLFDLLHPAGSSGARREPTEAELEALRRGVTDDVLGLLTPEQRGRLRPG